MLDTFAKSWRATLVRGLLAIVFGIVALAWPTKTIAILITIVGAYAFLDGNLSITSAFRSEGRQLQRAAQLLRGIVGVIFGAVTFFHPGFTALAFLYVIAAWAVVAGLLELAAAFRLRGDVLYMLSGIASVGFGVLVAILRAAAVNTLVWITGIYALVFGALLIARSFRLRSRRQGPASRGS